MIDDVARKMDAHIKKARIYTLSAVRLYYLSGEHFSTYITASYPQRSDDPALNLSINILIIVKIKI